MTVKFDLRQRTLTLSVGDLCSEAAASGNLNLVSLGDLRGELGREVHQEYQSAQCRAFPGYRAEAPLACELEVDGYRVTVQGRMDGSTGTTGAGWWRRSSRGWVRWKRVRNRRSFPPTCCS